MEKDQLNVFPKEKKMKPTDPLLGRHHLRPLTDQLFDDIKLPPEERVLLHVHLVNVHLQQVEVEPCSQGLKRKIATHCDSLPGTVLTRPEKLDPTCISLKNIKIEPKILV